jgi:hypothetical protein
LSLALRQPIASTYTPSIEHAILETLAYSDIFDYPLTVEELHRYLGLHITLSELNTILDCHSDGIDTQNDYYFLAGRGSVVTLRKRRAALSNPLFQRALRYGRLLGRLPFIRMVALTGSLALLNSNETADLDYMLVAAPGRVWTARGFALILGRLTAASGYTLCPNLIVSEKILKWRQRDLYSAREICQMIPIAGAEVYARLRQVNAWTDTFLPNALNAPRIPESRGHSPSSSSIGEWVLQGEFGDRLEKWEMDRKVIRLSQQSGFGAETVFNKDICQGNFHQHGTLTLQAFHQRLVDLGIKPRTSRRISESHEELQ